MNKQTQSLELTLPEAIEMYPTASIALKTKLEGVFGKKALITDVLERLKDAKLEDFYAEAGRKKVTRIDQIPEDLHELMLDIYDGIVIHEAVNQGQRLSFKDTNQKKWCSWLKVVPSGGVAFNVTYYNDAIAYSGDASRLRAISEKAAFLLGNNADCQKVFENIMNH